MIKEELNTISTDIKILTNNVNNNISSSLLPILYEELHDLSNETSIEKSLWIYFRKKVSDVSEAYYTLKNCGIETIKQTGFASNLLGSGTIEMIKLHKDFPPEFTQKIDSINEKHYSDFLDSIFIEFNLNSKDDKIVIIKTITIQYFRKNIRAIYHLYKETRHLIHTDDYVGNNNQPKRNFMIANSLNINPEFLKKLIADGTSGIKKAIELIQIVIKDDDEKMNELAICSGRFYDYNSQKRTNTGAEPTELNQIRYSLLQLIDNL